MRYLAWTLVVIIVWGFSENSSLADTELEENQVEAIAEEEGSSLPEDLLDGETEEEGLNTAGLETRRRHIRKLKPQPKPAPPPAPKPKPKPKPKTKPTAKPTPKPTPKTTPKPTEKATPKPTEKATPKPTEKATTKPTEKPTSKSTQEPPSLEKGKKSETEYTADPKNDESWNQFTNSFLYGLGDGVGSELAHQAADTLLTCRHQLIEKNSTSLNDCDPFIDLQNDLQEKETNGQEETTDGQDETSDGQYDTSNLDERWNSDPGRFAQQPPIQDAVNVSVP
uniref:PPM-type phosphatase domain-containing protein n=1 Tax=Homalodisca liturata TaxID=320908 RepID=A0A1B6III5_9HEMI